MTRTILLLAAACLLLMNSCEKKAVLQDNGGHTKASDDSGFILAERDSFPPVGTITLTKASTIIRDATIEANNAEAKRSGTYTMNFKGVSNLEVLSGEKMLYTIIEKETAAKTRWDNKDYPLSTHTAPLKNRPILLEKKNHKWIASLKEGVPHPNEAAELEIVARSFDEESQLEIFGESPRKIGDSWNVDATKVGPFLNLRSTTGTFAMEFVRIENFQGMDCAVLAASFDVTGEKVESSGSSNSVRMNGKATFHRSLKDFTNIELKISGNIEIRSTSPQNDSLNIKGPIEITQTISITHP